MTLFEFGLIKDIFDFLSRYFILVSSNMDPLCFFTSKFFVWLRSLSKKHSSLDNIIMKANFPVPGFRSGYKVIDPLFFIPLSKCHLVSWLFSAVSYLQMCGSSLCVLCNRWKYHRSFNSILLPPPQHLGLFAWTFQSQSFWMYKRK